MIHSLDHVVHNPRWEFTRGRRIYSKDIPSRATLIREALEAEDGAFEILPPVIHSDLPLYTLHHFVDFIRNASTGLGPDEIIYPDVFPIRRNVRQPTHNAALAGYYCFDTATPITRTTYAAAKSAADCALTGADMLDQEGVVYALCRPPGHHAEREVFGGYCYFNNPALAAQRLSDRGRVAVLDIDFHHANGTQQIFYSDRNVLTVSIHGDPEQNFPFFSGFADERGVDAGTGFNLNLPLPKGASPDRFFGALDEAMSIVRDFSPSYLVLAVGFDTCKGDPAGSFDIETRHYPAIATRIAQMCYPTLIIQEGGYRTRMLGKNAVGFLRAYEKGAGV